MASASQLLKEYKQYNMPGFINELEKQYGERTNYNKDLIEQENRLTQEQLALPAQLREQYYASPIRNALAQESLIAGRQANVGSQLGTVTDLLNARKQQYSDILGKASSTYQMNMENAWRLYQDASAREEAARNRAASLAAARMSIPSIPTPKENGKGNGNGSEPSIDVEDRSLATRALDSMQKLGLSAAQAAKMFGIDVNKLYQTLSQSGLGKSFMNTWNSFLTSKPGQQYTQQSQFGPLLQSYTNSLISRGGGLKSYK